MSDLAARLEALLGPDRVSADAAVRSDHAGDRWFASADPDVVTFPRSAAEVSQLLAFCNAERVPVTTRGAGVGYVGGCVPAHGGVVLSTAKMDAVLALSPEDGVAVVGPGVITGVLQAAASDLGWFYPPDPASLHECSIGGNIATNAGGPRCLKYGVTRHYVLGLEAVLADGTVLRPGGRCHKNKTGFDLVGLMVGSEGMLGVVTEATLRLIPEPPARAMLSAGFASFPEAAAAVQHVLGAGFLPSALEISDQFTLAAARDHLGAAQVPPGGAHLLVEVDGQPGSVRGEGESLHQLLTSLGALAVEVATDTAECSRLWGLRREFSYSLRATGLVKLNEDVVVPRSRLVDLVSFAEELQASSGFPVACFGHAGDGNIHVNVMVPDMDDPAQRARADAALDRLFKQVLAWGGVITGEHGVGIAKSRWFADALDPGSLATHRRLKAALDPNLILNPGKFLG
jgi:glycolate oxidase subunit GlcD